MQYRVCAHCHTVIPSGKRSCPSCGPAFGARHVKLCPHDGTPIALGGRHCTTCGMIVPDCSRSLWIWWSALVIASAFITLLLSQLHHYIYTTYQPMSCLIDGTSVYYHHSKNDSYYEPDITYEVVGENGQRIAVGDDAMGLGHYVHSSDAQAIVDQYHTGSTYTCWYSIIASPSALLVAPQKLEHTGFLVIIWFLGSGALFLLAFWLGKHAFVYPWQLRKRGVTVDGTVVDYEVQRSKTTVSTFSLVKFQTQTQPPLFCRIKKAGREPLYSQIPVLYDPLNPARNARAGSEGMGCAVLFLLVLLLIGAGLLVWLAFSF